MTIVIFLGKAKILTEGVSLYTTFRLNWKNSRGLTWKTKHTMAYTATEFAFIPFSVATISPLIIFRPTVD